MAGGRDADPSHIECRAPDTRRLVRGMAWAVAFSIPLWALLATLIWILLAAIGP
jgi:hypothetical protein